MTSGPLRVQLPPGEVRVVWDVPLPGGAQVRVEGQLTLAADAAPRGQLFGDAGAEWIEPTPGLRSVAFPQARTLQRLSGRLLDGRTIVLIDARLNLWSTDRTSLVARAALVGRDDPPGESLLVTELEVQVEGLDAVTSVAPIRALVVPGPQAGERRHLEGEWTAVGEPESTQVWSDADAEVDLQFLQSVSLGDAFSFRVTFSPLLTVRLQVGIGIDEIFARWVEPLRRLLMLSTGRLERITYVAVRFATAAGSSRPFQVFGSALHQEPYASRGREVLGIERSFFVGPQHESLLRLLRRWQELADDHHPLLETYGSMMFVTSQHPRSRLLLLLQALEGWHGYEERADVVTRSAEHTAQRIAVLAAATPALDPRQVRFLKQHLHKRPQSSLDQVLRAAMSQAPSDVTEQLEQTSLCRAVMTGEQAASNVFDALRQVRNDLSHGTRGYDARDLAEVADLLDGLAQAHLLASLGLSSDAQRAALTRRRP